MKKQLLCTVAFLASVLPFGAQAADLGVVRKAPVMAPAPVPVATWAGLYLGGNIGWGWTRGSGTITIAPPGGTGPWSGRGDGVVGGVQAGYNWQTGPLVFGVEADIQASGGRGPVNAVAGPTVITATGKNPWFSTFRGRLGVDVNQWLLYVTGGAVYGGEKLDGFSSTAGAFSSSTNAWSWTVGAGIEKMLWDRWSGKIEFLAFGKPDRVPLPPNTTAISGNGHSFLVRTGLNYHF